MPQVQTTGFQPVSGSPREAGRDAERSIQRSLRLGVADALGLSKGHDLHGLALAIREKLSSAVGADAVPSVLETINHALDDAAAKLAAQGVSRDEIDAGVARFRGKLTRELSELAGAGKPEQSPGLEKSAIAAREVVHERFSMDILTAEGDRVSIRFKSLSVTEVAAAKVSNGSGSATAVEANVISRGRFKLEVDGDLNEAERAAIGNLLDKVDDIATDFFSGDVQAAFSAAARVALDSSALSAFDLRLSYSRSLAAVQTYASNAKLAAEPAAPKPVEPVKRPAESQVPAAEIPQPAAPATAVTPAVAKSAETEPVNAPASEGTATTAAAAATTAKAASARETIASFTKDILERLDKDDESDAAKFSLRWKVEFLLKGFGSVALTQTEQAAADALGIALDGELPA